MHWSASLLLISVTTPPTLQVTTPGLSGVVTPVSWASPLGRGGHCALVVQVLRQAWMMRPEQVSPAIWQGKPVLHGWSEEFEQTFPLQVPGSVEKPSR